ncbi:type II toxin-antitoxin system VapB family antitoxin [Tunicatimonas pelagia]|uniref:type II toxin-antitoxin system VapB family antitoxin n=1 Tax=Tunicatimonas pelagia TaxID=931531 RepID=UPI002666FB1C|nr:type II toxin-antitoxin system VapB family antitoxin [Tunicatimonas pelagia]WKN44696.1 type II toxin-antitoxin system VapB family antitoxin [Tunicatimonas pelagia]
MRTNIEINDELMASAMKAMKARTKREVVEEGLRLVAERAARQRIMRKKGEVELWEGYTG